MGNIKPTNKEPVSPQSEKFEKDFKKTMVTNNLNIRETQENLNEVDSMLTEVEQSLKKKIFSLAKMEALVFSDPKLSTVYEGMAENGEEKYGYHYNETIMNMIFNDYILNSPQYLQKYKQAIPKEKKRRDKSGINQLKKQGAKKMTQSGLAKLEKTDVEESTSAGSAGGAAGYTGYAGPSAWSKSGDLMGNSKKSISESNYLTDPSGFEKYVEALNEETDAAYIEKNGSNTYGNVDNMNPENQKIIKKDIQTGKLDSNHNIKDGIALQEKAKSKSQQRFMGMVNAVQKGELDADEVGGSVAKAADTMSNDDVDDFASTKHKGLPDHVDEVLSGHDTVEYLSDRTDETPFMMHGEKWQFVNAKYPDGKRDLGVYRFGHDLVYDYKRWMEEFNINENNIKEDTQTMIQNNGTSMSNKSQATGDMSSEVPMGAQQTGGLNEAAREAVINMLFKNQGVKDLMKREMIQNIRNTIEKAGQDSSNISDDDILAISNELLNDNGSMDTQQTGGLNENEQLLEEINKELEAFSIHHDKLKLMSEERKTNSQILNARVGDENSKNFKKDFKNSDTKEIIDVEKELEYKDQQTDVPKDPQKLGKDLEKQAIKNSDMTGDEALKNVGNSTNDNGDEVPKRNLTTDEQDEVDLYRNGQHSLVYDNEPDKRFDDRMKADMGEDIYKMREKQLEFKGKAPMYNKDPLPTENTTADKVQFDKEQTGWNERMGLKESMITGRYIDILGKRQLMEFRLNEVTEVEKLDENITMELGFDGLGNTYLSKTVDKKVIVNEAAVNAMSSHKFYTDGESVVAVKNPTQSLNEGEVKEEKPVINEQMDKMKHLLGYKPDSFVNTKNVKKNRGF